MKRINNRTRHGRRQQQIYLPPSGMKEPVMAMSQKQRDERRREKEAKSGAEELRIKALSGEKKMVRELMEWTDDTEQASMILACIRYVHSLGPDGSRKAMKELRALHKVVLSESVERRLIAQSMLMIQQDPGDEVLSPTVMTGLAGRAPKPY